MKLFGNGRCALVDDPQMAERIAWPCRKPSLPEPEILLKPARGNPRTEPWICRSRPQPGSRTEILWHQSNSHHWTYLPAAPGVEPALQHLSKPHVSKGFTVGITGMGRVGGTGALGLMTLPRNETQLDTLLIHDTDAANLQRWKLELGSVARWKHPHQVPSMEAVDLEEMFLRSDAVLFVASQDVPPLGSQGDVRLPQFEPNRSLLRDTLAIAQKMKYSGLFFAVSDPVECLAQAAFFDSNSDANGSFTGLGLAPERVAGLALGVMWGRALEAARIQGKEEHVLRRGVAFGPHTTEVLVYDDPLRPDPELSQAMSQAARTNNYRIRELGFYPYLGPGISSIALSLPPLLAGKEVLASPFVDGLYFGCPCSLEWGLVPRTHRLAPQVKENISQLHQLLEERMAKLGMRFTES